MGEPIVCTNHLKEMICASRNLNISKFKEIMSGFIETEEVLNISEELGKKFSSLMSLNDNIGN